MESSSEDVESSSSPALASAPAEPDRRDFMQKAACVALGGVAALVPIGVGVTVVASPLFEETPGGVTVRLASADALEVGGAPQLFRVVAERQDAWTRHPSTGIGSVFVQRLAEELVPESFLAFNASCPHLGGAVEYLGEEGNYSCPYHNSTFADTGEVLNPDSPSPRGLDSLGVEIREGELWVAFVNFKANIKEKLPVV